MPRLSRICSVIDCGRSHHANGLCKGHYDAERAKAAKRHPSFVRRNPALESGLSAKAEVSA